jgi:arsenate reductase
MAEAILARKGGDRVAAGSAGSDPGTEVHPLAIDALRRLGIEWNGVPKGFETARRHDWDLIITVCDNAREACPTFPGKPVYAHWGIPDPALVDGSPEERRRAFVDASLFLSRRIDLLLSLPTEKLAPRTLKAEVDRIADEVAWLPAAR